MERKALKDCTKLGLQMASNALTGAQKSPEISFILMQTTYVSAGTAVGPPGDKSEPGTNRAGCGGGLRTHTQHLAAREGM